MQLSLSIDSVINPQPTGIYIVIAHLIPPGGLFGLDNLDNSYVVCCYNVFESETWFQKYSPNENILEIKANNIEQALNSMILFEIKSVSMPLDTEDFDGDDSQSVSNLDVSPEGYAILPLVSTLKNGSNFINQGSFQLPIIAGDIDQDSVLQMGRLLDSKSIFHDFYLGGGDENVIIPNSSISFRIKTAAFEVSTPPLQSHI